MTTSLVVGRLWSGVSGLTIMDGWSREALAIEADTSLNGQRVVRVLEHLVARRGKARQAPTHSGGQRQRVPRYGVGSGALVWFELVVKLGKQSLGALAALREFCKPALVRDSLPETTCS